MKFLDEAALKKITAAVGDAEKGTAGEIAVVVASRSAPYAVERADLGVMTALLAALGAGAFDLQPVWIAALAAAAYGLVYFAAAAPALTSVVVPRAALDDAVQRAAKIAFLDNGVHRTRDRSGVLVYLSLLERRVQIIGDEGVHKAFGDEGWRAYAARVVEAMKQRRVDGLVDVVKDMGAALAKAFPPRADDVNELKDEVVVQR